MSSFPLPRKFIVEFTWHSTDASAADPRIDALRAKIFCVEDQRFSVEYHDPAKRSIGNSLLVELNDGTVLDEVEIEYPVGHKRRRAEGTPLLINKFKRYVPIENLEHYVSADVHASLSHISHHFDPSHQKKYVYSFSNPNDRMMIHPQDS